MSKLDGLITSGIILISLVVAHMFRWNGIVSTWVYAWMAIFTCWLFIPGFIEQIRRNRISGRAAEQLSWNAQIAGIAENLAWILMSCASGDPVIFISCVPAALLGQVVLAQMIFSTGAAMRQGRGYAWLKYASILSLITIFAVVPLPLFFKWFLRSPEMILAIAWATALATSWSIGGWAYQLYKNSRVGWRRTGSDFSIKVSVAFVCSAAAWLVHEYMEGSTGWPMYTMYAIIAVHTTLILQVMWYRSSMQSGAL